ncbi:MAG: hypothetical protein IKX59_09450 [Bacteroidales bacterium]|nr:hypothetical protein [Bacteroidales bacterium]
MIPAIGVGQSKPLPKWATTNPISTATVTRAVAAGNTLDEARHNAVNILVSQKSTNRFEEGSYQYSLIEKGQSPVEQHSSLVRIAENSAFFKTTKTFEGEDQSYIFCEISDQDYRQFCDSLYTAIVTSVDSMAVRAQSLKQSGDLFTAATIYCKALQALVPILHKQVISRDFDLVEVLHDGYIHSMDSIKWSFDRPTCPMVPGEDVPVAIYATATYNDKPVPGLPVSFTVSNNGKVKSDPMTDASGRAKAHITEAPMTETAELVVGMNKQSILDLPKHIFSGELPLRLMEQLHSARLSLKAFDPTPYCYMEISKEDFECIGDTLHSILLRNGYKKSEDRASSDIVIKVNCSIEPDGEPTVGKYQMQYHLCDMTVSISDCRSGKVLATEEKKGLRLFVPANSDETLLHNKAFSEIFKRLKPSLNEKVKKLQYDKRSVFFGL